jgi:hypothetical protein
MTMASSSASVSDVAFIASDLGCDGNSSSILSVTMDAPCPARSECVAQQSAPAAGLAAIGKFTREHEIGGRIVPWLAGKGRA